MNNSIIQLIVLGAIAVFLIVKLRSVLGTRDGFEKPPVPAEAPGATVARRNFEVIEGGPDHDIIDFAAEGSANAKALAQMKQAEPSFVVGEFLKGARSAYEMILTAFDAGEVDRVRGFLSSDVAAAFDAAATQRKAQGLTVQTNVIGIRELTLQEATFDATTRRAEVTVRYKAELTRIVKDANGATIEGSSTEIRRQGDSWTCHVIVVVTAMDKELTATVPSALAATATGMGYTQDAITLMTIAQYIRNLGYEAHASMNDTGLNIPLAIQAGLGEYGRHGLVITKEFGPRVRIGKIFTDMPLKADKPIRFGVTEFCQACNACAANCPPRAIPFDAPKFEAPNVSSFKTIKKWTTDAEKCFKFWTQQNTECSICIRVCPYNRSFKSARDRLWRWLAGTRARRLALWLDRRTRNSGRKPAQSWWEKA